MTAARPKWRPPLAFLVAGLVAILFALPMLAMASVVAATRSPAVLYQSAIANWPKIALALVVVLAASAATGYVFWRGLARPLAALARRADRVARGGAAFARDGPFGTREVAGLATSFATVVERLQQRSRYLETLSAHLAHELKSPLTAIRGAAELLLDEGDGMDARERERFLANILKDAEHLAQLVSRLRDLARADMASGGGSTPLAEAAASLAADRPALAISLDALEGATLPLAPGSAAIVLRHLADNAALSGARRLTLSGLADGTLEIGNDGRPIPEANREQIFKPFFTTRREAGGTGLGLAIVAALVSGAGGRITLEGADPVRFRLSFPGDEGPKRREWAALTDLRKK